MPEHLVIIKISHGVCNAGHGSRWVDIASWETLSEILSIGFPEQHHRPLGSKTFYIDVCTTPDDARLLLVQAALKRLGLSVYHRGIVPVELRNRFYSPEIKRRYSPEEIASAALLRLLPSEAWIESEENEYDIADRAGKSGEQYVVEVNLRLQSCQLEAGYLSLCGRPLVAEGARNHLEQAGLEGLDFLPVLYDQPELAARPLWQLWSTLRMPRCLTPRQDLLGHDWGTGNPGNDCILWDDGGYEPEELSFARQEVAALGPFDIALTQEMTGAHRGDWWRDIIVSQKFREVMESRYPGLLAYVPVRLVDGETRAAGERGQ